MNKTRTKIPKLRHVLILVIMPLVIISIAAAGIYKWAPSTSVALPVDSRSATSVTADSVAFTAIPGKSVLAQLKQVAKVKTVDSTYGPYVDSINGKAGGTNGKYWVFLVDGKSSTIGADKYMTKGGEAITWKLTN